MNATRLGGAVVMVVALAAGVARANGTVTMHGDRATIVGRLDADGVVVINPALAFALRKEGLDLVPVGSWVRAQGTVLAGARRHGESVLLRLKNESLERLEPAETTRVTRGLIGAIGDEPAQDAGAEALRAVSVVQAGVGSAVAGRLTRDEWDACLAAWRVIEAHGDGDLRRKLARSLGESSVHLEVYAALGAGATFELVMHLLASTERGIAAPAAAPSTLTAMHRTGASGPQVFNWAGRACNELFEELQDELDDLKAAVRARVKALNAQASLSRAQVEEIYDLYHAAAATAAYGAVSAVLTEEGGKAYKAWQASRATGGRRRVYVNYQALGGQ